MEISCPATCTADLGFQLSTVLPVLWCVDVDNSSQVSLKSARNFGNSLLQKLLGLRQTFEPNSHQGTTQSGLEKSFQQYFNVTFKCYAQLHACMIVVSIRQLERRAC